MEMEIQKKSGGNIRRDYKNFSEGDNLYLISGHME